MKPSAAAKPTVNRKATRPAAASKARRVKPNRTQRAQGSADAGSHTRSADRRLTDALEAWFSQHARAYPWRAVPAGKRNAYHCLVLEAMAQQTQLSRVLERLPAFLGRFPTVESLARASEDDVLSAWRGMGYYRRARNLRNAAILVCEQHAGALPRDIESLRALPGVGRYTAGAIASMAFGDAAPIVDGNVARVLLRIEGRDASPADKAVQDGLWQSAARLVTAAANPGVFNEALMELGATVCLPPPASPKCDVCPWQDSCEARRQGRQSEIPRPKPAAKRRVLHCASLVVLSGKRGQEQVLLQKRPDKGLWAGLWAPPTLEDDRRAPGASALAALLGIKPRDANRPILAGSFTFTTTHRDVRFKVYAMTVPASTSINTAAQRAVWRRLSDDSHAAPGVSNAHRRVIEIAQQALAATGRSTQA